MGIFANKYRYGLILLLAGYSYLNAGFSEIRRYYPIPGNEIDLAGYFLGLTLLIWEGNRLVGAGMQARKLSATGQDGWSKGLLLFFGLTVAFSLAISVGSSFLLASYVFGVKGEAQMILVKLSATLGTRINLFLQVINAIYFFLGRLREKEGEANELRRVNAQAEVQAIRSQLNPHFLFNNLNVLSSLVLQERPEATHFIDSFTNVYRQVLSVEHKEVVPLSEELAILDDYVFLLRQRFPDSIEIHIQVEEVFNDYLIAPLALQMLIENAVKHNTATREFPLCIGVRIIDGNQLTVENSLRPRPAVELSNRIGLANIDQRYWLLCRQHIAINRTENTFSVTLPLIPPIS